MKQTSKERQTAHVAQERARQTGYEKMLTSPGAAEVYGGEER